MPAAKTEPIRKSEPPRKPAEPASPVSTAPLVTPPPLGEALTATAAAYASSWQTSSALFDANNMRGNLHTVAQNGRTAASLRLWAPVASPTDTVRVLILDSLHAAVAPFLAAAEAGRDATAYTARLNEAHAAAHAARQSIADAAKARASLSTLDRALEAFDAETRALPAASQQAAAHARLTETRAQLLQTGARLAEVRSLLRTAQADVAAALRDRQAVDPLAADAGDALARLEKMDAEAKQRVQANEALIRQIEPRLAELRQQLQAQARQLAGTAAEKLFAEVQASRDQLAKEVAAALGPFLDRLTILESAADLLLGQAALVDQTVKALTDAEAAPVSAPSPRRHPAWFKELPAEDDDQAEEIDDGPD